MSKSDKQRHLNVFLSYSAKDKHWVTRFASALRSARLDPWFDASKVQPGSSWKEAMQDALRRSDTMVVILSRHSLQSPWTFFELGAAVADGKKIIPILTEDIDLSEVPVPLAHIQILRESSPIEAARRVAAVLHGK